MIDISEEKFIEYLEQYANNEISMPKLIKKLESDFRTVNNKIMEISATNPDLYYKIVTSHPYKQKSRTDIDYEALMIYVLKHGLTIQDAVDTFHVSRKTIQRRVNETKETNPELYDLFKSAIGRGGWKPISSKMQDEIDRLEGRTVIIGEVNEEREKYLLDIETRFNELVATGMSKEQAAKQMGYTRNYLWKVLNELNRIRKEKSAKKENENQNFRKKLSDMSQYSKTTNATKSISDNGGKKGLNSENGIKDENSAR